MDINYDIIGKGSDSSDPIKVTVDSHATSASICFRYQLVITHDCCTDIYCNNACENVSLTPNTSCTDVISNPITSITWANQPVYYQITQLPNSAFTPYDNVSDIKITENNLKGDCGSVTKKVVPYSYNVVTTLNECGDTASTSYNDTTEIILDCSASDDDTSKIYDGSIVLSGENVTYKYKCKGCTCEPHKEIGDDDYTITYSQGGQPIASVPCTGATNVDYTLTYNIYDVDENCNRTKVASSSVSGGGNVQECSGSDCNKQHDVVFTSTTLTYEGCDDKTVNVSISMEGCETCEPNVTYCVDQSKEPEVYYFIEDGILPSCDCGAFYWVEDEEEVCYDLSNRILTSGISAMHGTWDKNGAIPSSGGWLWLDFEYTATTTSEDCSTSTTTARTKPPVETTSGRYCHGFVYVKPSEGCDCSDFSWGEYIEESASIPFNDATESGCNIVNFKYRLK